MTYPVSTFFDATHCPGCQAMVRGGGPELRCGQCGLPLGGPGARRLAGLLADADRALAELRREPPNPAAGQWVTRSDELHREPSNPAAGQWVTRSDELHREPPNPAAGQRDSEQSEPTQLPPYPGSRPAERRPDRRLPAIGGAAILLGLGGLCLVVAAIVFLSMSWTTLTLTAKVAVLAGVTGLLAALATTVTRRQLRGSAEALWAITLIDLALDVWAARRADLAGLHSVSMGVFTVTGSVLLAAAALGCLLAVRRSMPSLASVQLVLGIAGAVATMQAADLLATPDWLTLGLATIALAALAIVARGHRLTITAWTWAVGAVLSWLGLVGVGAIQIAFDDFAPQLWHGQACELPTAIVLAALVAGIEPVLRVVLGRTAAATAAFGLTAVAAGAVAVHYLPVPAALALTTLPLIGFRSIRQTIWRPAGTIVLAATLILDGLLLAESSLTSAVTALDPAGWWWQRSARYQVPGWRVFDTVPMLALLVATAVAALAFCSTFTSLAKWIPAMAVPVTAVSSMGLHPTVLVATLLWSAAAVLTATLAGLLRDRQLALVPAGALGFALLTAATSDLASAIAFGTGAALVLLLGYRLAGSRVAVELGSIGLLFVAIAAVAHRVQPCDGTPAVAGLLGCATVFAIGAVQSPDRRWWQWPAFGSVTMACWIEAASHHVQVVELYSLPLGVLTLAFGIRAGRRDRAMPSWLAYGPGLLLGTVPTALTALAQPLSWRAGAIGLAALVILGIGYRRQLQAPLLIGATELGLLVLRETGPYALALPRWVGIGAIGLLLLGIGISWEDRLGNLRRAQQQLAGMR